MATSTEVAIATYTLASGATSITFSSIPSTYTDLRLVVVTQGSGGDIQLRLNGDTGTNYSITGLTGNGTTASSGRETNTSYINMSRLIPLPSSPNWGMWTADFFSYAGSTYKTVLTTGSADRNGAGGLDYEVGLWRSTSAINTVRVQAAGDTFATGSVATLYGIL